jgi:hypothetical protein
MVFMTAGMLDHRNIGSHVSLKLEDGVVISGALAVVVQRGLQTALTLAFDDEEIIMPSGAQVEVNLAPAAAYTLHLKNAVEDLLNEIRTQRSVG